MSNSGFDPTMGASTPASAAGGGTVVAGANITVANGNTVAVAGSPHLTGTTAIDALNINAGGVIAGVGHGLSINTGTLGADWNGGAVSALGSGLTLVAGTLAATGGGGSSNKTVVTVQPWSRPLLASFTWRNQGSATAVDITNGPLSIKINNGVDTNNHGLEMAVPGSTPWTLTVQFGGVALKPFTAGGGAYAYVTDGTKFAQIGVNNPSQAYNVGYVIHQTTTAWSSGTNAFTNGGAPVGDRLWLRISNDGTNLIYSASTDGAVWDQWFTEAKGAFLGTITAAGFLLNNQASTPLHVSLLNWELVTGAGSSTLFSAVY